VVCRQRGEDAALQAAALMQQGTVLYKYVNTDTILSV
jgi:hypothetical protein